MNAFGVDVSHLDVASFVASARATFPWLALLWIAGLWRARRPGWFLAGALAANAWAWGVTNYPLQRIYGLGPSSDRVGNLALVQVAAAGTSPLETWVVGQLNFEPFWSALVAALSGWSPARVLFVYPFLPLLVSTAFALSLYFTLSRSSGSAPDADSGWAAALASGSALLLSSAPLDFAGVYRVPWALAFLLKPNHAVGLILLPIVLRSFAGIRGVWSRLGVGLLLHVLGWAFVLHMVYVAVGLLVYAALSVVGRRQDARRDSIDVLVVIGVNLLVVSPYLYMLLVGYPFLARHPVMTIPPFSPHLLEPTIRLGPIFALGLWGAVLLSRRGDRLGRVWSAQVLGALIVWVGYLGLSVLQLARERDEINYWLRILVAICAGIGAWDLARRVAVLLRPRPLPSEVVAAAVSVLALPWTVPYWWEPSRMDSYFSSSLAPLPDSVVLPTTFLRERTDPRQVVAGDRDFARYVAALGARQSLLSERIHFPKDAARRFEVENLLVRGTDGDAVRAAAAPYRVQYLVVTPRLLEGFAGLTLADIDARIFLRRVHLTGDPGGDYVAIYELRAPGT